VAGIVLDVSRRPGQHPAPGVDAAFVEADERWPLVGRERELGTLQGALIKARRSIVLVGPSGVGKSRLGAELRAVATTAGYPTSHVTGTRAAGEIPFGALAQLLPRTELHGAGSVDDRADLVRRCVAVLAAMGAARPIVMLVDDMHLLDNASATVLHQAVATGSCLVVATVRDGEPTPDVVQALWKDGLALRYDVGGLTESDTGQLLATALGGSVDPSAVGELFAHSRGNGLYLRELVRGALGTGVLVERDRLWRLVGRAPISRRLAELVETRLMDLTVPERNLLESVAYGEPLGWAEVRAISGEDLVEDLERRGFLVTHRDGRRLQVRLTHPVYADVLLSRLSALRRQRLARVLADIVESTGARRREDVLRVATWRLEGGGSQPELMLRAAVAARWSYDFALAERLGRAAAGDGAGFEAELLVAQLCYLQGRGEESEARLVSLAGEAVDDGQRGRHALARLECAIFLGHIQSGLTIAERAEGAIADTSWRNQVTARRAGLLLAAAGPRDAVEVAAPLLRQAGGQSLVWACLVACLGLGRLGRLEEAIAAADLGLRTQLGLTSPVDYYPWLHVYFRGDALIYAGRFEEAMGTARGQYELAVRERSTEAQAYFGLQLARPVSEHGDVRPAIQYARAAAALFRDLGRPALLEPCLTDLVISLALSGQVGETVAALGELDRLSLHRSYYAVEIPRARAWAAIARGALPEARGHLDAAVALGKRTGDLIGALDALHTIARIGHPRRALGAAVEIGKQVDGVLPAARVAHVKALTSRNVDALVAVGATFEATGAYLLAAEAATEAALAAHRRATPQRAAVLRRDAARLRRLCPDAVTPTLRTAPARAQLTPAEAEAAYLATSGLSNREIAERLHRSVRTVEGQLQRCYEKLSITRRSELATALRDAPPD
jgi:DNA-binding NarL/FixJ family response regulator